MRFLILLLLAVGIPQAIHSQVTPNMRPTIRIIQPLSPVIVYSSNAITIRVEAADSDGSIRAVQLNENGVSIASDFQFPYEFLYSARGSGTRTLEVWAIDNLGATATQTLLVEVATITDNYGSGLQILNGTNLTVRSTTVGATRQKGEPNHAGAAGGKSVWFAWRPLVSGTVAIDTFGSTFDTVLGVYTNRLGFSTINSVSNLVTIASSDDDPANRPLSSVKFLAAAMHTYFIAVDGRDGFAGDVVLNIRQTPARAAANDSLAYAVRIPVPTTLVGNNIGATKQNGEPEHAGNPGGASMWWRYDVSDNTTHQITTRGSNFDTLLAVYTNIASASINRENTPPLMENLRLVASNDDAPDSTNRTSTVEFKPTLGISTYWIAVDGYNGAEGIIRLAVNRQSPQAPRPPNDLFVNAAQLRGSSVISNITITGASSEPGEPRQVAPSFSSKSVWYRWVAPAGGPVYLSTEWSDFDTLLGVFVGSNLTNLSLIAANDDDGGLMTSALVFNAVAGIEYRIAAAGYPGSVGDLLLMLNQPGVLAPRLISNFTQGQLSLSATAAEGTYILESSTDLANWSFLRILAAGEDFQQGDYDIRTARRFYRLRELD